MNRLSYLRAACALAAAPMICFSAITTANSEPDSSPAPPTSLSKALPALATVVGSGSERACSPTHLTVTGKAADGSRVYASALVSELASALRKNSKGRSSLTRQQAREIQRLIDYAIEAQRTGAGLPQEALDQIAASTGMRIQATMVCLSIEQFGSR